MTAAAAPAANDNSSALAALQQQIGQLVQPAALSPGAQRLARELASQIAPDVLLVAVLNLRSGR